MLIPSSQGIADLCGNGSERRVEEIINNCAHLDYHPILREFLRIVNMGHEPKLKRAIAFYDTFLKRGGYEIG